MKILKGILIVVISLIALLLIIALFVPKTYVVSVSQTIRQPKQVVFDYVRIMQNQKSYSVWVMADPDLNPEIIGTDGTVGAIQKWNSKIDDVGEGEQEIKVLTPERMEMEIRFIRPWKGTAKAANIFKAVSENETEITSEFYSEAPYPFNLPAYLFGRKMIQEAQTKSLQNMKRILERQ